MRHLISGILALCVIGCKPSAPIYDLPTAPEEVLNTFQIREGFRMELFASEPFIADPVEMIFDEKGRAFVVEMPDYPFKPEKGKARSRVRMLEDKDGDGKIDHSVIFADKLVEATSILSWKGGLIVTSAPDILYFRDTDQDGLADEREVLFTGFFEQNPEIQITNLRYGLDNWIYAANFGQKGSIISPLAPDHPPVDILGSDFRFRLDTFQFEPAAGPTQFGHDQDDWGHRFVTMNTVHLRHLVIPKRYLNRNPLLNQQTAIAQTYIDSTHMYQLTPPPHWRAVRTARRQKSYDEQQSGRIEWAEDHFTGCSGSTFYLADGFPASFYGSVFTGDVAGNLVHRDVVKAVKGSPTFQTMRPEDEQDHEFIASTDSWFRPANFAVGPDGFLYVIDMYRQHIETPLSIPEDLKLEMDFYAGDDMGRIYRIVTENYTHEKTEPVNLTLVSSDQLLQYLAHTNRWYRLNAQRLLIDRKDVSIEGKLKDIIRQHPSPQGRLHALYTLEGLGILDQEIVVYALQDPHPGLREHAIRLGERFAGATKLYPALTTDTSAFVALQAILSLGELNDDPELSEVFAQIASTRIDDPWFQLAILSGQNTPEKARRLLMALGKQSFFNKESSENRSKFTKTLASWVTHGETTEMHSLLDWLEKDLTDENWRDIILEGLSAELKNNIQHPDPSVVDRLSKLGNPI